MQYQLELVWNREFHFVPFGKPTEDFDACILAARQAEEMGDGERVRKTRIVDQDRKIVWQYGKKVLTACPDCGRPVDIDGYTTDPNHCQECVNYSSAKPACDICGYFPCDQSC